MVHSLQVKLEPEYHDRFMAFCNRNGATKTDAVRYMIDTLQLEEGVGDDEFTEWLDERDERLYS